MKKVLFVLVLFNFLGYSQQESKSLIYTNIIQLDSVMNSKKLFVQAKSWFSETFKNSKSVIQYEDKDEGIIIGKGVFNYNSNIFVYSAATKGYINYTIKLYLKDGRYKYEISNFIHEPNSKHVSFGLITTDEECPRDISTKGWRNKVWKDIKKQIDENMTPLIISLETYMIKANIDIKNEW